MPPDDRSAIGRGGRLLAASGVLSVLGIVVATYLTIIHYRHDLLVCGLGGGCHTVQSSSYAEIAGIPVAIFGLGMYVAILGLVIVRAFRPRLFELATTAAFAIALSGVAYAGYLTYVELFVIDAICQWCVISATLTVAICIVEGITLWRLLDVNPAGEV